MGFHYPPRDFFSQVSFLQKGKIIYLQRNIIFIFEGPNAHWQEKLKAPSQRLTFLYCNEEFCLEFNDILYLEFVFKVTTYFWPVIGHYWVTKNIKWPLFSRCKKAIAQCLFGRSECCKIQYKWSQLNHLCIYLWTEFANKLFLSVLCTSTYKMLITHSKIRFANMRVHWSSGLG